MTSTKDKGDLQELVVEKILKGWGYDTHRTTRKFMMVGPGKWISQRNDMLGCIDVLAVNQEHVRFVQVTDSTNYAAHIPKVMKINWPTNAAVEIWAWYGGHRKLNKNYTKKKVYTLAQIFKVYRLDLLGAFALYKIINKEGEEIDEQ